MKALIKLAINVIGFRGFVLIALVACTSFLGTRIYCSYDALKKSVSTYQDKISKAEKDNRNLTDRFGAEKQRADTAEGNVELLKKQNSVQKAEIEKYHQRLTALKTKQDKDNEKSQATISLLKAALDRAGVVRVRVPDDVTRLQQKSICRVNGNCANRDGH